MNETKKPNKLEILTYSNNEEPKEDCCALIW